MANMLRKHAERCVSAAAAELDKIKPGWEKLVDPAHLNLAAGGHLEEVYGDDSRGNKLKDCGCIAQQTLPELGGYNYICRTYDYDTDIAAGFGGHLSIYDLEFAEGEPLLREVWLAEVERRLTQNSQVA